MRELIYPVLAFSALQANQKNELGGVQNACNARLVVGHRRCDLACNYCDPDRKDDRREGDLGFGEFFLSATGRHSFLFHAEAGNDPTLAGYRRLDLDGPWRRPFCILKYVAGGTVIRLPGIWKRSARAPSAGVRAEFPFQNYVAL